jgi:hypothetical protein
MRNEVMECVGRKEGTNNEKYEYKTERGSGNN